MKIIEPTKSSRFLASPSGLLLRHLAILPLFFLPPNALAIDEENLKPEATQIIQEFGATLKPKLQAAIQAGGFPNAIEVCSAEAPEIARSISAETGWEVRRVSLKPRNAGSAIPDDFEKQILEQFDLRQLSGELPETIAHSEHVDGQYRFMKAIPVEGICLSCHGENISPEVTDAISEHYLEDLATGYSLGQIRGAFSILKKTP